MKQMKFLCLFALCGLCLVSGCRITPVCPLPGYERDGRFYCYTTDYFKEGTHFGFLGKALTTGGGNGSWTLLPPPSAIFPGLPLVYAERFVLCPVIDTVFIPFDCGLRLWNAHVCANEGVWIKIVDGAGRPVAGVEVDLSLSVEHGMMHAIYDGVVRDRGAFRTALVTDENGCAYVPMYIGWRHVELEVSGRVLTDRGFESFRGQASGEGCWCYIEDGERHDHYERWQANSAKTVELRLRGVVASTGAVPDLPDWVTFAGGMKSSDFLDRYIRTVGGEIVSELHDIKIPTCPVDFDVYWNDAGVRMRQGWTGEVEVAVLPELSTPVCRMSRVTFAAGRRRFTGLLSEPVNPNVASKMPVLAFFPARCDPKPETLTKPNDRAVLYFSVFESGYDYFRAEYDIRKHYNLSQWAVCDGYALDGIDRGREEYFFYPVLSGAMRAAEWLTKRSNSTGVCCRGAGQGASMAIMTAAMSEFVEHVEAFHPEFVGNGDDLNAWPRFMWHERSGKMAEVKKAMPYYELCGFAKRVKCSVNLYLNMITTPGWRRRNPSIAIALSLPDHARTKLIVDDSMTAEKLLSGALPMTAPVN